MSFENTLSCADEHCLNVQILSNALPNPGIQIGIM